MKTKRFFSAIAIIVVSTVVLLSSCSKSDEAESVLSTPLTIVKTTPADGFNGCVKNQIYTIEFSDKIVFDNANPEKVIGYVESITTKEFKWTATYDGNKTITIKATNNIYFVYNNEFFWHFKKGAIKTPDGRVLADDGSKDGCYLHYFTLK